MPLILILRFHSSLLSLAILTTAAYFLWRWYDGVFVRDSAGVFHRVREDWHLWIGVAALAWSLLGGLILRPLLASPDNRILRHSQGSTQTINSPTGSKLFVETYGDERAPTLVLTHGWGLDRTIWGYLVEDLSAQFRIVTWDLPGAGRSKGKIALESFAADLAAVVELSGGRKVVLVGHSIGGMTIQTLVRDDPDFVEAYVAGIVLLNTTHTNPLKTMILSGLWRALRWPLIEPLMWLAIPLLPLVWISAWQSYLSGSAHLANRIGFGKHVGRSQLNTTTLLGTRNSPAAQARGNLAMFRWSATGALSKVDVPTLVIGGTLDIVTKPEASHTIADSSGYAHVTIVGGVNHMGFLERFDTYNAAISTFAKGRVGR